MWIPEPSLLPTHCQEEDGSSSDESSVRGVTPEQQSMSLDRHFPSYWAVCNDGVRVPLNGFWVPVGLI